MYKINAILRNNQRRADFFSRKEMYVNDELDILGGFFNEKLFTDHYNTDGKSHLVHLGGYIDSFNQYYFYEQGITKYRAPKPAYSLSGDMKSFVTAIEKSGLPGRFSFLFFLLLINSETGREFIQCVKTAKKQFKKEKQLRDFSMTFPGPPFSWGITYMLENGKEITDKLSLFCQYKLSTTGLQYWVGIGDTSCEIYRFTQTISTSSFDKHYNR